MCPFGCSLCTCCPCNSLKSSYAWDMSRQQFWFLFTRGLYSTLNWEAWSLVARLRGQYTQAWQVTGPWVVRSKATANDFIIWVKADTTATTKQQHRLHLRRHFVNVYILHIRKFACTCLNGGYWFLTPSQPYRSTDWWGTLYEHILWHT